MRKLTKGEKRNIMNEIRRHENMIDKLEKMLYDDENRTVLLTATKTITELNVVEKNNVVSLKSEKKFGGTLKVSVEHVRHGNKVICTLKYEPRNIVVEGVAICAIEDMFDISVGMSIAEYRATAKLFESIAKALGDEK